MKFKQKIKSFAKKNKYILNSLEKAIVKLNNKIEPRKYSLTDEINIQTIVEKINNYCDSMRILNEGKFLGYKHSASVNTPLLYDTVAVFLLKNLIRKKEFLNEEEISLVLSYQKEDGLFYDKYIDCPQAYKSESWGWKHLTLHVLMMFSIYDYVMPRDIKYVQPFYDNDFLVKYLRTRDWESGVVNTSNEIQNLGVMLQYERDYHKVSKAGNALNIIYEFINKKQRKETGLFGDSFSFKNKWEVSYGVQAGYHLWLLYFYDNIEINYYDKIIDYALQTQNMLGGYGVPWNSSACEDIDSIDPLMRFLRKYEYRNSDILKSLDKAISAILFNFNPDGGFVFRRHEPLLIVHKNMYSGVNESNVFYTWFRTLGLAYALDGLGENAPINFRYRWNFKKAIGHQFIIN